MFGCGVAGIYDRDNRTDLRLKNFCNSSLVMC